LELAEEHYPTVLQNNDHIRFRLQCRKFVEMVRTRLGENDEQRRRRRRIDKGKAPMDLSDSRMDLDDQDNADLPQTTSESDGAAGDMDTAEDDIDLLDDDSGAMQGDKEGSNGAGLSDLDLIEYGQELSAQFSANPRKDIRQELENMNGLMAYPNPKDGPLKELLEERGRIPIAEELNSAILGKILC
jgi:Ran-binding protein 9/10